MNGTVHASSSEDVPFGDIAPMVMVIMFFLVFLGILGNAPCVCSDLNGKSPKKTAEEEEEKARRNRVFASLPASADPVAWRMVFSAMTRSLDREKELKRGIWQVNKNFLPLFAVVLLGIGFYSFEESSFLTSMGAVFSGVLLCWLWAFIHERDLNREEADLTRAQAETDMMMLSWGTQVMQPSCPNFEFRLNERRGLDIREATSVERPPAASGALAAEPPLAVDGQAGARPSAATATGAAVAAEPLLNPAPDVEMGAKS